MEMPRLADRYFDVEMAKIAFFCLLIRRANAFFFYLMN